MKAYEVHPDAQLEGDAFFYLYEVLNAGGSETLIDTDWSRGWGRTTLYPKEGTWRVSAWTVVQGAFPRVSGLYGEAWSGLITVPPDPEDISLSFVNETSKPNPYVYWRTDDDAAYSQVGGRYQIYFGVPVKTDEVSQYISLWKDGEQMEAEIVPVRPINDPDYGEIAVFFNIYAEGGYIESDFAASIESFYTIRIDAGVPFYNGNTSYNDDAQDGSYEYNVEAFTGGGGEELPKLGLKPPDKEDDPGGQDPSGGSDLSGNPNTQTPEPTPASPATPSTPSPAPTQENTQSSQAAPSTPLPAPAQRSTQTSFVTAATTPVSGSASVDIDIPDAENPLAAEAPDDAVSASAGNLPLAGADGIKGTQRSGPVPDPDNPLSPGIILGLAAIAIAGVGARALVRVKGKRARKS